MRRKRERKGAEERKVREKERGGYVEKEKERGDGWGIGGGNKGRRGGEERERRGERGEGGETVKGEEGNKRTGEKVKAGYKKGKHIQYTYSNVQIFYFQNNHKNK